MMRAVVRSSDNSIRAMATTFILAGSLFLTATPSSAEDPGSLIKVVTTLTVLADLVREVGRGRVTVASLSDPRQDPHFVQPRPTLMKRVREADVFVEVGLQLELWAQKVVDGAGNGHVQTGQPGRIVASSGIATLDRPQVFSRAGGDVHPQGNPHVWLDPLNAKRMTRNIATGLARVAPQWAGEFDANAKAFARKIDVALFGSELVGEVGGDKLTRLAEDGTLIGYLSERGLAAKLGGWLAAAAPLRGQKVVTYHKTWPYFARRFGLVVPIEIEEKPGISPSARHRDTVVELVKRDSVRAIVSAIFYDRRAADYVAERTQARVVELPIEPTPDHGGDSYLAFMEHLIDTLVVAVQGEP
jgi:ABC-type Zn uptake system ZnuABC Zn-binding protein ZnuA